MADKFTEEPLELLLPAGFSLNNWQDLHSLGFINHPDGNAMATRLLSRRFPGNPGIHHIGLIHRAEWPLTRRAEEALAWLRQHLSQESNAPLTVSSAIYR
ncbi:hypothetical protein [Kosakonia sacchari]|uniref:hypothetical protein n=1 Tax=Kosakonia sacchari TaxID=1158459 RepID=UPI0020C7625D|nr:hypothetical protein [Kosakonia sacchari]